MELTSFNVGTSQFAGVTEVNTNEFTLFSKKKYIVSLVRVSLFPPYFFMKFEDCNTYETRRVVVTGCLGVTKSFKYRVGLHDLIFQVTLIKQVSS